MPADGNFTNPVIEGDRATFTWHGKKAPRLLGDFNDWEPQQAYRLKKARPRVWQITLELPEDAYIEYTFLVKGDRVADPGNPQRKSNGVGGFNNYFYMPQGRPALWVESRSDAAQGRLTRLKLDCDDILVGKKRAVTFYCPPSPGPYPLLVVYDGQDYHARATLPMIVDNLLASGRIQPVALAMVASASRSRNVEYACCDATLDFLFERVLPAARDLLDLVDVNEQPGSYGALGASMGGLMALYTGLRCRPVFGKVLSQSGAFLSQYVVHDLARMPAPEGLKVWMDVGVFESLVDVNRQMRDLLQTQGYDCTYREYPGGHNYTAWRDDIGYGLELLFGGTQKEG